MNTFPRLVADIGGTNARFAIEYQAYNYRDIEVYQCNQYPNLIALMKHYFKEKNITDLKYAGIAIPTPITDDIVYMVNNPWKTISLSETKKALNFNELVLLNDFHALALSIPNIADTHLKQIGGVKPDQYRPKGIIGPGTGLGVASLIRHPNGEYLAVPAEGGHSSFIPVTQEEVDIWNFVHRRFHHVSFERLISGPGIVLIYEALASIHNKPIQVLPTADQITQNALSKNCWLSDLTLDHFCRMLGTIASNLAVTINAFGGVYIGGGIIPKILDYFEKSGFRCRFEDKGRMRKYLEAIPVYVILEKYPAFLGASRALDSVIEKGYLP